MFFDYQAWMAIQQGSAPYTIPIGNGLLKAVKLPQEYADEHTLAAQRYAGYFVGHPYRAAQHGSPDVGKVVVETDVPWREPPVVADDCEFCRRLTDESAVRRVAGFQNAIDIEVIRGYSFEYSEWLKTGPGIVEFVDMQLDSGNGDYLKIPVPDPSIPVAEGARRIGYFASAANRRRFVELFQDEWLTEACQPNCEIDHTHVRKSRITSMDMTRLPLRLKRKLCIEWNHIYLRFLKDHPEFWYDWETREFLTREPQVSVPVAD